MLKKICLILLVPLLLLVWRGYENNLVMAASGLGGLVALLNTSITSEPATHQISFTLPQNSLSHQTDHYIIVHLNHFSELELVEPSVTGSYVGSPSFSIPDDNNVKITGIGFAPGTAITIDGIRAINPYSSDNFQVIVMLTEDEEGLIVKNIGNVVATTGGTSVSVTASIDSPQASIRINGYTSPASYVTFTQQGAVYGTTVASDIGFFSKTFSGLPPGDYNFSVYSVDINNQTTSPHNISLYAPPYQLTTVTNLLLSPSMQLSASAIEQGDPLVASGRARPGTQITLFTEFPIRTYTASTSASGNWSRNITDTGQYVLGDYHAFSIAQDGFGVQSLTSPSIGFSIISPDTEPGDACGDISKGDLNCDGIIDLTDFSILMFYWGTNNAAADINQDGIVDLTDFSIMMYWWGT